MYLVASLSSYMHEACLQDGKLFSRRDKEQKRGAFGGRLGRRKKTEIIVEFRRCIKWRKNRWDFKASKGIIDDIFVGPSVFDLLGGYVA